MSTYDNIVAMDKDRLKEFIRNLFKADKAKADMIRELEYQNDMLDHMLKTAYCRTIGADSIHGLDVCDNYKDWKSSLAQTNHQDAEGYFSD